MIFTGKNLQRVRRGIDLALGEIHNQIATCPDVELYAEEIKELRDEEVQFKRLLARIDRSLQRQSNL